MIKPTQPLITRFAPSPTGFLHLGGARTAVFNWIAAKSTGGRFLLRIDDTDTDRSEDIYLDDIKSGLKWLGIGWDKMVKQSDRTKSHHYFINHLIKRGYAISHPDGGYQLNLNDKVRDTLVPWTDMVAGQMLLNDSDWNYIKSVRITRSDGTPLYNVASIADDINMKVNLIIRGADHITNTHIQWVLAQLYGITDMKFAHVGLIHGADGKKMSKRNSDDTFLLSKYINDGYSSDAIFNCLLRLGWGPTKDDKSTSVIYRADALDLFWNGNLRPYTAKFDIDKLNSWDRKFKARDKARNK